jgi:LuxR family maltose regulon positive regulatory protein
MARTTPRVEDTTLVAAPGVADAIAVGSPAWYAWLEQATTFAFAGAQGGFTARKEHRGRSGWYWKAYRKQAGQLRSAYLGKSADLTLDRLNAVALTIAAVSSVASGDVIDASSLSAEPAPETSIPSLPTGTVTFLFTDIEGSSQLWEQHPQAMPQALAHHDALMRHVITAHMGIVFKMVGDGVHAAFARAADALTAALAAQRAICAEDWGVLGALRVRMALHTGVAELRDADYFGPPLNRVARILALGHGGQVILSRATEELARDALPMGVVIRDLGAHALKDLSRPEQIFQVITADLPTDFPPLRTQSHPPGSGLSPSSQLLATKLHMPPVRPNLLARPRLVERLQAGLLGKLTLISAPAGFGKSTLLSAWLAERQKAKGKRQKEDNAPDESFLPFTFDLLPFEVAWVSLDAADSDPLRFWSYVIAALDILQPDSGTAALALLQSPQPPPIETVLTPLLNALNTLTADAVLILDDYHLIDTPAVHSALAFLIDYLPLRLHLVITTRVDPPLPLTRLRAQRSLTELRAADLRFTAGETAAFLTELMGLPLSADDVAALEARTEGWIAGLQFAALAMRDRADLAGFVQAFRGSNRFVVDYLAEEVLTRQPTHLQTFLLQTAILDRMCGPLCDTVLGLTTDHRPPTTDHGGDDPSFVLRRSSFVGDSFSQIVLEELERANLFVVPLDDDRHWYRYHHLFAELLRERLRSGATSAAVATLHRRASAWFEQQDLGVEAIQHALAGSDWEWAARLIERYAWAVMFRGQLHTVLGWFNALPATTCRTRPTLYILHAIMLMHTNQLDAAETRLLEAEQGLLPDTPAEQARLIQGMVQTTRSNISFYRGDLPRCIAQAQQALALLPGTARIPRTAAAACAAQAFLVTGDVRPASERQVAAVVPAARAADNRFVVLRGFTLMAQLQILQGRLHAAAATYRQAAQLAPEPGGLQRLIGSAAYYFGLGNLHREWNDLAAAEEYLAGGMERILADVTPNALYFELGSIALARLQHARGDHIGAQATLERFADLGYERAFDPLVLAHGAAMRARLSLAQGNLDAAVRWADTSGLHADDDDLSYLHEAAYLTLASVHIAQGRQAEPDQTSAALRLLDRLLAAAEAGARMGSAIEILSLQALALQVRGDLTAALSVLTRALALAAPEGYIRLFVDEGAPMVALLHEAHARGIIPAYVTKLLAAFPRTESQELSTEPTGSLHSVLRPPSSSLVEPLSERELEVLRLIADGHSNQAIADRLVVAVGTVKKHINNLYGKLGVQSRTQALARAGQLRLL